MKKFKFLPPYREPGKTNFPQAQRRSGVYLIREDGELVYVGMSGGNLYKTMYRHFKAWSHKTQQVVSYQSRMNRHRYTVRVVFCTPGQAARLEKFLIIKNKPRDNEMKYDHYQIDFYDKQVHDTYTETLVTYEVPF